MAKRYIMTVLAVNRTGILAALANALDELGGNMRDVSQAVIDKYFAVIMAAEFPEDQDQEVIVDHIRAICRPFGAEVTLRDPSGDTGFDGETEPTPKERYVLTLSGPDRPGVLRFLAHRLALDGIDLVDLQGRQVANQTFMAAMELSVPPGIDALHLCEELKHEFQTDGITVAMQHRRIVAALSHPEPVGFNTAES
ncbi:ACT domain-containing protein [Schlesneria paludicola]|uniref:ACT domain-containing protein n=1 Tax=Schlesneria paludicola TaxID=360056 RepID=UPI00029A1C76|nr:ACT domain-containing protein [Schlesneria paludicola]